MLSRLLTERRSDTGPSETAASADGTHYLFKPSLAAGAKRLDLAETGLNWSGAKPHHWPYADIDVIRLSYRPASMQPWRFRADITTADGERLAVYSTTWHSIARMARQDDDYRAFIVELHRRLECACSHVRLEAGIHPVLFFAGVAAVLLVGVAIAALFLRALFVGQFAGAAFLAGFAAWFTWQAGGFLSRNRPRRYTFDALPKSLLP